MKGLVIVTNILHLIIKSIKKYRQELTQDMAVIGGLEIVSKITSAYERFTKVSLQRILY